MQKHLLRYPWICLAMIAGILACIAVILHMLLSGRAKPQALPSGVTLVKEAARYAAFRNPFI